MSAADRRLILDGIADTAARHVNVIAASAAAYEPPVATAALVATVPDLVATYADAAAVAAADYYDERRDTARLRSTYRAEPAPPAAREQSEAMARWATEPIWSAEPDTAMLLTRIGSGTDRLVRQGDSDTILHNVTRDPAKPRWARNGRANACSFCLMLISRGAVYAADTAEFQAHDHCRCTAAPVFRSSDVPDQAARLQAEWKQVTSGVRGSEQMQLRWRQHVEGRL